MVTGIDVEELKGRSLTRAACWARQVAIASAVRLGYTGHYIGNQIGRNHSTIYYGLERVKKDDKALEAVEKVLEHLKG